MVNYHGIETSDHEFGWLCAVHDLFIYAPKEKGHRIVILSPASGESYSRGIVDFCRGTKYDLKNYAPMREESLGFHVIDVAGVYSITNVRYIYANSLEDIQQSEFNSDWLPDGEIKKELADYLLKGIFASSVNRCIVPIWIRWTDQKKYSLFMWLLTQ